MINDIETSKQLVSGNYHVTVVPSDTVDFATIDFISHPRALIVTVTGNVAIMDQLGTVITYLAVPAYTRLDFRPKRVMATGTTATVVAWY